MSQENKVEQIIALANETMPTEFFSPQEAYLKGVMFGVEHNYKDNDLKAAFYAGRQTFTEKTLSNWDANDYSDSKEIKRQSYADFEDWRVGYSTELPQHSYTEQKWVSVMDRLPEEDGYVFGWDETAGLFEKVWFDDQLPKAFISIYSYWKPLLISPTEEAALTITTPPTYTQEQMLAFGEAVLKEAADRAVTKPVRTWSGDQDGGTYEDVDKQSILSIDCKQLLK